MAEATIFKTGALLSRPTIGVNKFIINFKEGGATELAEINQHAIYIKKPSGIPVHFTIKFYNGSWLTVGGNAPINTARLSPKQYTDEHGNVINEYHVPDGYVSTAGAEWDFHYTVGTTRIEFTDIYGLTGIGVYFQEGHFNDDFDFDISQFAVSPFVYVYGMYCSAKGDLSVLADRDNLKVVHLQMSDVTGDINSLAKSARTLETFRAWKCTGVYGTLESFAEALKQNGAVSKTIGLTLSGCQVTWKGMALNGYNSIIFDENGDYEITNTQ